MRDDSDEEEERARNDSGKMTDERKCNLRVVWSRVAGRG